MHPAVMAHLTGIGVIVLAWIIGLAFLFFSRKIERKFGSSKALYFSNKTLYLVARDL